MKYILITFILFHNLLLGPPPPHYLSNVTDPLPSSPTKQIKPLEFSLCLPRAPGCGTCSGEWNISSGAPLQNWLSLTRSNQVPIAPWLGMGLHVLLPHPCWDFIWLEPGQVWCTLLPSLSSYVQLHAVCGKRCFLEFIHRLLLLEFSFLSPIEISDPWLGGCYHLGPPNKGPRFVPCAFHLFSLHALFCINWCFLEFYIC